VTFLLVRSGAPCRRPSVFVGLFLSLCPDYVPTPSRLDGVRRTFGRSRQLRIGSRSRPQRIPFTTGSDEKVTTFCGSYVTEERCRKWRPGWSCGSSSRLRALILFRRVRGDGTWRG
jgi:hypothetical protein